MKSVSLLPTCSFYWEFHLCRTRSMVKRFVFLYHSCRMSDGGLLLSWNDSSHTTYMKEEVDRLVCEQIKLRQVKRDLR